MAGRVSLVGAGPGDPGWITWRGLNLLRTADVVVHDRLVAAELLREVSAEARVVDAGKAPGRVTLEQEAIHELLIAEARAGHHVVRLKGGDPFVFGRGFEELAACRAAGVECEVVPGISSAIAGPAAAGIPVTLRGVARSFAVVTAHSGNNGSGGDAAVKDSDGLDWSALARLDTVVVLMGRARLQDVGSRLIAAGRSASTPAALVEGASTADQRVTRTTLGGVGALRPAPSPPARLAPAVLVVGEVARHARLRGEGALAGRRVLITRPESAGRNLRELLRRRGAEVLSSPLIRVAYRRPRHFEGLFAGRPGWVVFTSRHGVRGLWQAVQAAGGDARAFAGVRIAVVGPSTAAALADIGLSADLIADPHRASALVAALTPHVAGEPMLFPCGSRARREVVQGLRAAGAELRELVVYSTLSERLDPAVKQQLAEGVDAVLFHSPSAVRSWVSERLAPLRTVIACIGASTAEAALRAGLEPSVVASLHTDEGLVTALEQHFRDAGTSQARRA